MNNHNSKKLTASFPDLIPLLGRYKVNRTKKRSYREIRLQLAYLEYENIDREHDALKLKVRGLMEEESKFQNRSAANISFWKLEHPYQKMEIRRLKAKVKQLEVQLKRFQKKVPIAFPNM